MIKKISIFLFDITISIYSLFLFGLFITDYSFIFRGGVSNLSIQGIIFAMLLCLRYFLEKQSFNNSIFIKFITDISRHKDITLLVLVSVVFAFIFSLIGLIRHFSFSTGIDLGVIDQAIWSTLYGKDILFTSLIGNINYLGAHFSPILLLIAPIYLIWPSAIVLIILQAIAISLAFFPLYLIAKKRLNNRLLTFVFVFAFFLSRPLRGIGLLDFHADVFLIPLVFTSYYLLITKRIFWATIAMALMLCCKESAAVLVFAYGVFTIVSLKNYRLGIILMALALGWWSLVTNFIMPYFARTESYPYLNWLPFGPTYFDNFLAVIKNPLLLSKLFFSSENIELYFKLFIPLGLLSFLSPQHYILFLLPLVFQASGTVSHPSMATITSHYPALVLPFIFIAAIYGAGKLIDLTNTKLFAMDKVSIRRVPCFVGAAVILFSILFFGKSDGHKLAKFVNTAEELHSYEIRKILSMIPEGVSVSAVHRICPHLTHRRYIYFWEYREFRYLVEYVILHRRLMEADIEKFDDLLLRLNREGFKEIYLSNLNELHIFYNPLNKAKLLKHIQYRFRL